MPGSIVSESSAQTSARQAAAVTVQNTLTTLLADIATYLAAGSGDTRFARDAVRQFVAWRLATVRGLYFQEGDSGYSPRANLSTIVINREEP